MKKDMGKVCFPKSTGSKSNSQEPKGVPLVITFHPKFKSIGQLLNKHLHILYMDGETKNVFTLLLTCKKCLKQYVGQTIDTF